MEEISEKFESKISELGDDEYIPMVINGKIFLIFSLEHYKKLLQ